MATKKKKKRATKKSKFARKSNPPRYHRWEGDKRTKTRACGRCGLKRELIEGPMGGSQVRYSKGKRVVAAGHIHTKCPPCPKSAR